VSSGKQLACGSVTRKPIAEKLSKITMPTAAKRTNRLEKTTGTAKKSTLKLLGSASAKRLKNIVSALQ